MSLLLPKYSDDSQSGLESRLRFMQGLNSSPEQAAAAPQRAPGLSSDTANQMTSNAQSSVDGILSNSNLSGRQKASLATQAAGAAAPGANVDIGGISGLSSRQSANLDVAKLRQTNQDLQANDRLLAYADGGQVETAEQLMARMAAKYGVSSAATPQAPAAPAPAPAPAPQQQAPGSMIQRTVGLISNRNKQIKEAAGFACGGKIKAHAQGGKIAGPGTETSDSIPAQVQDTGEPLLVSTGERILSAKQDALLEKIAKLLGFESTDAMLEAGTGQPVGPTMKGGKKAAATGMAPGYTDEQGAYHPSTLAGGAAAAPAAEDGPAPGVKYAAGVTPKMPGPLSMMAQSYGAVIDKMVRPDTEARLATNRAGLDTSQAVAPAPATPNAQISAAPPAAGPAPTPAPAAPATAPVESPKPGVMSVTRDANGRKVFDNTGGQGVVDSSASALIDQKNSTYNPARQLENMQRLRLTSDATDPTITDPRVRAQAVQGLAILNAGRAGADASAINQQNTEQARVGAEMRNKLLDPNTSPEEHTRITKALQAINGKGDVDEVKIAEATTFDPSNPMVPLKTPYGVTRSGKVFDVAEQAKAQKVTAQKAPAVPKVGEVRGGFKFKGGNPADQNAWEKA